MVRRFFKCATFHFNAWFKIHLVAAQYFLKECALRFKTVFFPVAPKSYCPVGKITAVVTGGTQGLGLETVKALLSLGARVIVGSSSPVRSLAAKQFFEKCIPGSQVEILPLDLRSMSSVDAFAHEVLRRNVAIDLLICNAGVMFAPHEETEDKFELHLSINYLGHCLLTAFLLPRLISAGTPTKTARIGVLFKLLQLCTVKAGSSDVHAVIGALFSLGTHSCDCQLRASWHCGYEPVQTSLVGSPCFRSLLQDARGGCTDKPLCSSVSRDGRHQWLLLGRLRHL